MAVRTLTGTVRRSSIEAEAATLIAALPVTPTLQRARLDNQLIASLKTAGVWQRLDLCYIIAAVDFPTGLINWINPSLFLGTLTSSQPTFTVDRGANGDASANKAIQTGFNPATAAGFFAQDDNSMICWSLTSAAGATTTAADCGNTNHSMGFRTSANNFATKNSTNTTDTVANSDGSGFFAMSRDNSANYNRNINGVATAAQTRTSSALTSAQFTICKQGGGSNSARVESIWMCGKSLTNAQLTLTYNATQSYLRGLEAV